MPIVAKRVEGLVKVQGAEGLGFRVWVEGLGFRGFDGWDLFRVFAWNPAPKPDSDFEAASSSAPKP